VLKKGSVRGAIPQQSSELLCDFLACREGGYFRVYAPCLLNGIQHSVIRGAVRTRRPDWRHCARLKLAIGSSPYIRLLADPCSVKLIEENSGRRPHAAVVTAGTIGIDSARQQTRL